MCICPYVSLVSRVSRGAGDGGCDRASHRQARELLVFVACRHDDNIDVGAPAVAPGVRVVPEIVMFSGAAGAGSLFELSWWPRMCSIEAGLVADGM